VQWGFGWGNGKRTVVSGQQKPLPG
jgi:hypothetical protein